MFGIIISSIKGIFLFKSPTFAVIWRCFEISDCTNAVHLLWWVIV